MSILYKPVKIESAAQAEALPIGTVAVDASSQSDVSIRVQGGWHCTGYCLDFGGAEVLKHSDMVGDQALVPIEAEEEFGAGGDGMDEDFYLTRRLVTPWEAS